MHVPFRYKCFLLLSDCSGSLLGLYFYSVLMEESSEGCWERWSAKLTSVLPRVWTARSEKNYPPHLFVWQLINICFDRFSCRYIFNPISKDWPFVRSGQSGWWTSLIVIHKRQGCHKSIPVFYFSFALCDNHFKATCQIYR